ncbi:MAG: hypothetical protein R3B48_17910 [Kofleriaceae bacterium]
MKRPDPAGTTTTEVASGAPSVRPMPWRQLDDAGAAAPREAPERSLSGAQLELALTKAREEGFAACRAEQAAERERLLAVVGALTAEHGELLAWLGDAALDTAVVVIEAWLEGCDLDRRSRLRPVVARWVQELGDAAGAVASVAPGDVAALCAVVDGLPIEVRADPEMAPGDISVRGERSAIELRWRARLGELRADLQGVMKAMTFSEPPPPRAEAPRLPRGARPETGEPGFDATSTQRWEKVSL